MTLVNLELGWSSRSNFRTFPSHRKIPYAHLQSLPVPTPCPRQKLIYYFLSLYIYLLWVFSTNGIVQYVVFYICLLLFTTADLQWKYYPHFTDKNIKGQRAWETCPKLISRSMTQAPGLNPCPRALSLYKTVAVTCKVPQGQSWGPLDPERWAQYLAYPGA